VRITATKAADPQGDTPAQYASVTGVRRTHTTGASVQGDTPSQYAAVTGARRTVSSDPIEIVQPERTIVRDRVPSAPVVLAGLALVVALIGAVDLRARRRTIRFH
jgi:carbohydrate-binding DOMON domain-containing protein